jgi:L-ascorbate metabolism protein UlaG (beta-lactamase superfamily)
MIIKYNGEEKFEIKTAEAKVSLSSAGIDIEGFIINTPGEYERRGVSVQGITLDGEQKPVYIIHTEEMSLCYPDGLNRELDEEIVKLIGDIDILFVPLGESGSMPLKLSQKLISDIDPRVVIPMLYADIEQFKSAEGITDGEVDQLKIKKAELPVEERKFYILKPNG